MALPANQLPIGPGLDPLGRPGPTFYIDVRELGLLEDDGPQWKYEDARFIVEAVAEPDAIFEGLNRPGLSASLCYTVRPTRDPDEPERTTPPRFGYVFVAFARPCVGGFLVFDWEWREECPDCPGHPVRWEADFARRTWHRP